MLEAIRVIVLERMHIMRNLCDKWTADICPNIQKRLEITKDQHRIWHVIPTGGNLFEVRNGSEAFGVDEDRRNCSCRLWQLSGLPCCHAITVIFKLNRMVEDYVPDCYSKQAFYDTYHQYLTPVGGMTFWPDCSDMSRVLPPKPRTIPEDYYAPSTFEMSNNSPANTLDDEDTPSPSSIIIEDSDASQIVTSSNEPITQESSILILETYSDEQIQEDVARLNGNTIMHSFEIPEFEEAESSSNYQDPSNMHKFHQQHHYTDDWTKMHPIEQVIGDPSKPV
ncbi:pentatricopeptide repeat-containing protein [Tanacetum coccineum]